MTVDLLSRREPAPHSVATEWHIASCVVRVLPTHFDPLLSALSRMHIDIHTHDGSARLVVVLEAASIAAILKTMDLIRAMNGVLDLSLVYQHCEPIEEISRTDHAATQFRNPA
jgi:periplasmic nitrate reductase NapD